MNERVAWFRSLVALVSLPDGTLDGVGVDLPTAGTPFPAQDEALQRLARSFRLSVLDQQILLLAAVPDLDVGCLAVLSTLGTGSDSLHITPAMCARLLELVGENGDEVLDRLGAGAQLRASHLLDVSGSQPFPLRAIVVADPVVELLRTGRRALDPRLTGLARLERDSGDSATTAMVLDMAALASEPDVGGLLPLVERDRVISGADMVLQSADLVHSGGLDTVLARRLASLAADGSAVVVGESGALPGVVRVVRPDMRWDDLVLDAPTRAHLLEIGAAARYRRSRAAEWHVGGPSRRGCGVSALFHGPSGTGKTSAAEAVAGDLGVDLLVVDLATVVSKYIGETEKNLRQVFAAARDASGVLLFDEAEALFGRRSPVRDAHDRYANIEIAYLLQLLDGFDGVAILTSNLSASLDPAFARRLGYIVEFRAPNAAARAALWERMLSDAPREDDLDIGFVSEAFEFTGGDIRNAALHSAVLAAMNGGRVGMREVMLASARETTKLNRVPVPAQMGSWADDVEAVLITTPAAVR